MYKRQQQTVPLGVEFNPDGTKMYMTGTSSNKVFQYTLTTAFDISTAVGSAPLADTCQLTLDHRAGTLADFTNLKFNTDGTKFFVVDTHNSQGERIDGYTLSTAYDISTCTYESSLELPTLRIEHSTLAMTVKCFSFLIKLAIIRLNSIQWQLHLIYLMQL